MGYKSDYFNGRIVLSLGPQFWCNLMPTKGDFSCLLSLFFDNLSTLVTVCAIFQYDVGGAANDVAGAKKILYEKIVPACGVALCIGNVYYSILGTRMAKQFGRQYTAQPYGINTVGCFPFLFGIMIPIAASTGSIETAWKAGVTGNFLVGCVNIVLGIIMSIPVLANIILKTFPIHSLTIPVAGVGITWLSINQIAPCFGTPAAGFVPMIMIFLMYYSKNPYSINGFKIPEVLHWIIPGFVMGWLYKLPPAAAPGWEFTANDSGLWVGKAFLEGFDEVMPRLGTVLMVALPASAAGLMCLVSAYNAGDPYPIGETMITDGLFTIVGAVFGSPFGTVIYFGHPIHKKLGGKYFFSFANGLIYLAITLSGVFPLILDATPKIAAGPTIFIFGLMLCEECTKVIPQRHHVIIFFGLFFEWCNYYKSGNHGGEVAAGLNLLGLSSILSSMLWCCILVYVIDRQWLYATLACCITSVFAVLGLIHQPSVDFSNDKFWKGSVLGGNSEYIKLKDDETLETTPRYSVSPLQCTLAYLLLAAICLLFWALQKNFPASYPPPIEQGSDEAKKEDEAALNSKLTHIGSLEKWWSKGPEDSSPDGKVITQA